jgi:hypothetical protein
MQYPHIESCYSSAACDNLSIITAAAAAAAAVAEAKSNMISFLIDPKLNVQLDVNCGTLV